MFLSRAPAEEEKDAETRSLDVPDISGRDANVAPRRAESPTTRATARRIEENAADISLCYPESHPEMSRAPERTDTRVSEWGAEHDSDIGCRMDGAVFFI